MKDDDKSVNGTLSMTLLALLLCTSQAAFAEREWYRYENAHFEAFSDDSRSNALRTLEELELFRAAVVQVANIKVPDGEPKVRVVIFASAAEFQSLIGSIYIGGVTTTIDGVPYLVVSDQRAPQWEERLARHEYAHVLLGYKRFPYPGWFSEGFAELVSTTTFRNRNREFSLGKPPGRQKYTNLTPHWDELLSSDFNMHGISDRGDRSDVYLFSWVLAHHFMVADNFGNTDKLVAYLTGLAQGQDSLAAFSAAVGEPAEQYCNKVLREYTKRKVRYVTYTFRPELLDLDFQRSAATVDDVAPLIERLKASRDSD